MEKKALEDIAEGYSVLRKTLRHVNTTFGTVDLEGDELTDTLNALPYFGTLDKYGRAVDAYVVSMESGVINYVEGTDLVYAMQCTTVGEAPDEAIYNIASKLWR